MGGCRGRLRYVTCDLSVGSRRTQDVPAIWQDLDGRTRYGGAAKAKQPRSLDERWVGESSIV